MELGEVRGQRCVVELAPVEPSVDPPQRPGVSPARVRTDGGLDQAARGRGRTTDLGLCGVDPGG